MLLTLGEGTHVYYCDTVYCKSAKMREQPDILNAYDSCSISHIIGIYVNWQPFYISYFYKSALKKTPTHNSDAHYLGITL